jgi:glycosyltransferase involved in cell wall biosynthesis
VLPDTHHAYESSPWRHHIYGKRGWDDGRPFDTVIPNFFDPDEFPHLNSGRGDYLLFVGRVVRRKGPQIAAEIARRVGMRLVVAGPGPTFVTEGRIEAPEVTVEGDVTYVGTVGIEERARLMADAAALIVPTLYVEPFGGVAVEAMMCGTPVVASDWGAFVETVDDGVTGYRFSTVQEGVGAVLRAADLSPREIRSRALERFSLAAVRPKYEAWFDRIETLWGNGYYEGGEIFSDRREMMPA